MAWPERMRERLLRRRGAVIAWNIAANQLNRVRHRPGAKFRFHSPRETEEAARQTAGYIRAMFRDYAALLPPGFDLAGRHVLEVGPGDQYGVALLFLAAGAASVTCLDKYAATVDPAFLEAVYRDLRAGLDDARRARLGESGPLGGPGGGRFRVIHNTPLESALSVLPAGSADLIVSRSVLEYLKDRSRAYQVMDGLLAPGGRMAHIVDGRDDGLFSAHGFHPLEFLTVSDACYHAMTSHTYRPNRWRLCHHRESLDALGQVAEFRVLRVAGRDGAVNLACPLTPEPADLAFLQPVRPRLAPAFRGLDVADLLTAGFSIASVKRGAATPPSRNP